MDIHHTRVYSDNDDNGDNDGNNEDDNEHPPYSSLPQPVTIPTASRNFSLLSLMIMMMMIALKLVIMMTTLAYRWGPHGVVSQWGFRAQEWQCRSQRWVPGSPCAPPHVSPIRMRKLIVNIISFGWSSRWWCWSPSSPWWTSSRWGPICRTPQLQRAVRQGIWRWN